MSRWLAPLVAALAALPLIAATSADSSPGEEDGPFPIWVCAQSDHLNVDEQCVVIREPVFSSSDGLP